jgi:hypothetical protein
MGSTLRLRAMAGMAVVMIVISSVSMKSAMATIQGMIALLYTFSLIV